jgi:1,4-dihydroxy-2-naphthoate octaprenyltransferase
MKLEKGTIKDILLLGRFPFLFGGLLLYILGVLISGEMGYDIDLTRAVFGYLVFMPAHLSVSYSNDLFDVDADKYNEGSAFSGGSGVLQRRPELKKAALIISVSLIASSIILSIVFTFAYSISPLFIGLVVLGSLLGWFYTAPPLKLSYRGFGEISTAATVGVLVPLYGFIASSGTLDPSLIYLLFPMALSGFVFILNVQTPDVEADIKGGKNTWVMALGRKGSLTVIFFLVLFQTIYYGTLSVLSPDMNGLSILPFFFVSLIPLLLSVPCIIWRSADKDSSTRMVTANMLSLFIFNGGLDLYFLINVF